MIKIQIILLFLFTMAHGYGQKQNGIVYYSKKAKPMNTESLSELGADTKKFISQADNTIESFQFSLIFNKNSAKYDIIEKLAQDTKDNGLKQKMALALSGFKGKTFFDFKEKTILLVREMFGETILIKSKFSDTKWELEKEKMIINNLLCFKAKTIIEEEGRNGINKIEIVAWYTPDINLPYGPEGFGGLPGLIVQLKKGTVITYLSRIDFKKEDIKIQIPQKGREMTRAEFNSFLKDVVLNKEKYYKN